MKYRKYIWKILLFDPDIYQMSKYDESQLIKNKDTYTIEKVIY